MHVITAYFFQRWIAIRLDFMGNLIIFAAALFASLQRNYPDLFGRINPGLAGLSITYALQVLLHTVQCFKKMHGIHVCDSIFDRSPLH